MIIKQHYGRNPAGFLQHIHVEENCIDLPYTREILRRSGLPYAVILDRAEPALPTGDSHDPFSAGKRHLLLCRNRGQFFKPCPGTSEYRCCSYHVLNIGMNCPMDCVYCILQAYLNRPWLSYFVNIDDMFTEMEMVLKSDPKKVYRIGTGEFTDSLALDRLTGLSPRLVDYVSGKKQIVLELKTKSACIDNLAGLSHAGRVVVAWSLNAPAIMKKEELRTATLDQRLAAAKQCLEWGYKLAFHFDPIIEHPGWRQGYEETIDLLFKEIPADAIVWISMGALRYLPHLKKIGTDRFPGSRIFYQEFIEGLDGKARYFRAHRTGMYKVIYERLKRQASAKTCIYFCMESDEIWREVMGFTPEEKGGIPAMLDRTVFS
ncbi:MAG: DNA photolyase [Desulfocapsaceae bacterium]|nr:DNA photolyase [Desulfocapsaceae bacterium]